LLLAGLCTAQDYLVTVRGDTLTGQIKPLNYGTDKKVQITEPGKKKEVYPFFKVKAYSLDNEIYQPVRGPYGYVFMKLLKTGYVSLYAFQPQNQHNYDGLFLLKRDGNGMEVPNLTFKKSMKRYLEDCPLVADRIENDQLNKKDINEIVEEYNQCIVARSNAIPQPTANTNTTTSTAPVSNDNVKLWETLENKVQAENFAEKQNALDMISEIKSKVNTNQRVPNFLIEGLKAALTGAKFNPELEAALKTIN
jgi:hypothetical protein